MSKKGITRRELLKGTGYLTAAAMVPRSGRFETFRPVGCDPQS